MIWLLLFMGLSSLILIIKNVEPVWIQHVAFGMSLAVLFLYIFTGFKIGTGKFGHWCRKKSFKWIVVLLFGVIIFAGKKYEVVVDYSQEGLYSLKSDTIGWLQKIKVPITLMIFVNDDNQTQVNADWLQEQIKKHTPNFKVEIKNLNRDALLVKKYGITKSSETVLASSDFWVKIDDFQEQDLLMGLMRLLSRSDATLCFLTGHGEPDISDQNEDGLLGLNEYFQGLGYKVKSVELDAKANENQTLDHSCGVLFVLSPKTSFLESEKAQLSALMKTGLPIVMGLDLPVTKAISDLLAEEGLVLSSHIIIDKDNLTQKLPVTDLLIYPTDIKVIAGGSLSKKVYLPNVQALEIGKTSSQKLIYSSVIDTPINEGFSLVSNEDQTGPFTIAAAATSVNSKPARVIFGSADWLRTKNLNFGDNRQLILGSIRWILAESMVGQPDAQAPPLPDPKYMEVSDSERWWIKIFSMYLIPGSVGFLCFAYWFQRKIRS